MARPRKDGLDYFPHDTDAHLEEEKVGPFRAIHGLAGMGFYWEMLERIYRTASGELVLSRDTQRVIYQRMNITDRQFKKFLSDALRLRLFVSKDYKERGVLTSPGIKKRFDVVQRKREQNRPVSATETNQELHNNQAETGERKGKEIKEKKKKEKREQKEADNTRTSTPTLSKTLIAEEKAQASWLKIRLVLLDNCQTGKALIIKDDDIGIQTILMIDKELGDHNKTMQLFKENETGFQKCFINRYVKIEQAVFESRRQLSSQ